MRTTTRNIVIAVAAAALMSPLAYAQTEGQPQVETPSAQSENAQGMMGDNGQGMMGGMMQGMQEGEMMPMMAQMHEMMEACMKMMQAKDDNKNEG